MIIQKFEDLIAWQKSQELASLIYKKFQELRDFGFKDQIFRAVISISNNIAEGFDRSSDKDFIRFLYYALGSCSEVKSMLYLSNKLKFLNYEEASMLLSKVFRMGRLSTRCAV